MNDEMMERVSTELPWAVDLWQGFYSQVENIAGTSDGRTFEIWLATQGLTPEKALAIAMTVMASQGQAQAAAAEAREGVDPEVIQRTNDSYLVLSGFALGISWERSRWREAPS